MYIRARNVPSPLPIPSGSTRLVNGSSATISSPNSAASMSARNMPPPIVPPPRTPSNGIMRPPVTPTVPAISPPRRSPSASNGIVHDSSSVNGEQDIKLSAPIASMQSRTDDPMGQADGQSQSISMTSPVRPKSQTPSMVPIPNGFTIPNTNYTQYANGTYAAHANMRNQTTKSALANALQVPDGSNPAAQVQIRQQYPMSAHSVPTNYTVQQLQAARMLQQQNGQRAQLNLGDITGIEGGLTLSLTSPINGVPPRTPSANGTRSVAISRGLTSPALQQAMAVGQGRTSPSTPHIGRMTPHPPHSPPNLLSPGLSATQPHGSPPRAQPPMPSPSLQTRQIVGGSGVGY